MDPGECRLKFIKVGLAGTSTAKRKQVSENIYFSRICNERLPIREAIWVAPRA